MKGGEERRRGLSRGSFRVFPLGLHIGNVQCHIHIPYREILICFIKYVYFLPSIFCLVIVSAKYRPVKMEEEGWSKNNGFVVGGGRGCKKHRSSYRASFALPQSFSFFPSYFLFFLPRSLDKTQMCCPKETEAKKERSRERLRAVSKERRMVVFNASNLQCCGSVVISRSTIESRV